MHKAVFGYYNSGSRTSIGYWAWKIPVNVLSRNTGFASKGYN